MAVPRIQHVGSSEWLDIGLAAGAQGGTLNTASSAKSASYLVTVGDLVKSEEIWPFIKQHGQFVEDYGQSYRTIQCTGVLRCALAARAAIMADRDKWRKRGGRLIFLSDDDTQYDDCHFAAFEITPWRSMQADGNCIWRAEYTIELLQVEP